MKATTVISTVIVIACFKENFAYNVPVEYDKNNVTDILEYVLLDRTNPCARKCVTGSTPMTCRYHFSLEWYSAMSKACYDCPFVEDDCFRRDCIPADGIKRPVVVVNRQMPGPSIEVCLGDEVVIDVDNQLGTDSTTIHWHGHHQRDSPYMDGVPFVTQCPVSAGTTFRYQFAVKNPGTHFWHSHSGFQRADGAFGSFVVRVPDEINAHSALYDYDLPSHTVIILDWGREMGLDKFLMHHHGDGDNKPATLLINGLGKFERNYSSTNSTPVVTPAARFVVEQGFRYRFRVINAGFLNCPIEISVDNHTMTAISTDGSDFEPVDVQSIVTYAGERFDFILKADQPQEVYWMRFSGLMDCDERFNRAHQVAVLQYKDAAEKYPTNQPDYEHSKKEGKQLNSLNRGTEQEGNLYVSMPDLKSVDGWDDSLKKTPDFQYYVSYDFYRIDNPHFHKSPYYGFHNVTESKKQLLTPQLNHISMKLLPFPLLSQRYQLQESMVCNETTVKKDCDKEYCECTHVVNIPLNAVVEMVLIDKGFAFDANHPFHLHGHSFRVVAMERVGKNVTVPEILKRDKDGLIERNLKNPPVKDTVTVPDGGYTIIRFQASNPGYWLFHCHIEFHVEVGMALVFKVGDDDEMPPVPDSFQKCGNYVPSFNGSSTADTCNTGGIFGELLKELLPDVYNSYCSGSNAATSTNLSFVTLLSFLLLVCYVGV